MAARVLFIKRQSDLIPPLGILQLLAVLRRRGHAAALCFADRQDPARQCREFQPTHLAVSVVTGEERAYGELLGRLRREHSGSVIAGGPHPTYCPDFVEHPSIDHVFIGEADLTLPRFLDGEHPVAVLAKGRPAGPAHNPDYPLELDALPFPDYAALAQHAYYRHLPVMFFFASRGCPFTCRYCHHALQREVQPGSRVRRHSPRYVCAALAEARRHCGFREVKFADDVFPWQLDDWLEEFCREYPRRVRLPFHIHLHPGLVTRPLLAALRAIGLRSVSMSIEAGNPRLRATLLGRDLSNRALGEAFARCHELGLRTVAENMIGLPDGSPLHDFQTLALNRRYAPTLSQVSIFIPYPRLPLTREAEQRGLLPADGAGQLSTDYHHPSVLRFPASYHRHLQRLLLAWPLLTLFPRWRPRPNLLPLRLRRGLYMLARIFGFLRIYPSFLAPRSVRFWLQGVAWRSFLTETRS